MKRIEVFTTILFFISFYTNHRFLRKCYIIKIAFIILSLSIILIVHFFVREESTQSLIDIFDNFSCIFPGQLFKKVLFLLDSLNSLLLLSLCLSFHLLVRVDERRVIELVEVH